MRCSSVAEKSNIFGEKSSLKSPGRNSITVTGGKLAQMSQFASQSRKATQGLN
jgi:hypothetical protein